MKNCENCNVEFEENKSFEKYCSSLCRNRSNQKKRTLRVRLDSSLRDKKNAYEKERNTKVGRKRDRLKHNEEEKKRYREKNGINSDEDLRVAKKGSGTTTSFGYRQIIRHDHPNSRKDGQMFEHVFVMSEYLGRPLIKGENVHHKNGIRHDNRVENLELWSRSQPYGQRVQDKIQWCREFLNVYGFDVIKKEV
jgi:hypothetical protein